MAERTWVAKLDGVDHKIELQHDMLSGKRRLLVDGWEVHKSRSVLDLGEDIRFGISGRWGIVRIAPSGVGYSYRLALNELWVDDWTLVTKRPRLVALGGAALLLHAVGVLLLAPSGTPDVPQYVALVATRVLLSVFFALQVFGGVRWGWYAALGYAGASVALAVAGFLAGASAAWVPADLRSMIGVALSVVTGACAIGALVQPSVRKFYAPAQKAEPAAA